MKMDNVEFAGPTQYIGHHRVRVILEHVRLAALDEFTEVHITNRVKLCAGNAIRRGKESDVVPTYHQLIDQQL